MKKKAGRLKKLNLKHQNQRKDFFLTVYDEVSKRHKFVHKIFKKLHIDKEKYYAPMEIPGVKLEQMIFTIKKMRRKLGF